MKNNKKGVGMAEMIIAMSLFLILYLSAFKVITTVNQSYNLNNTKSKINSIFSETYSYLYVFKKNLGTFAFESRYNLVNENIICDTEINGESDWCIAYVKYVDDLSLTGTGNEMIRIQNHKDTSIDQKLDYSGINKEIYLQENVEQNMSLNKDFFTKNSLPLNNFQNILFYKKRGDSEDFYDFIFRVISIDESNNVKVIFDKKFSLF